MRGEIIKDLSSPYTKNNVYLFDSEKHGQVVKKVFSSPVHFKREVEAYKKVERSLHPSIFKVDMPQRTIYMSYNPVETPPEHRDETVAAILKKLHTSTKTYKGVVDPGSGWNAPSWKDYIKTYGSKWVETLKNVENYTDLFNELLSNLNDSGFAPVSLIHRDIQPENIGERKGSYILFDYELAIWGDPYWDVARYALQSADSKEVFFHEYGVKDRDKAEIYVQLFALCFAAYLFETKRTEKEDFKKCLAVL